MIDAVLGGHECIAVMPTGAGKSLTFQIPARLMDARVTLWDRLAEIAAECVSKGDRVYVEGRLEYGSYERDGVTIPTAEVVGHELLLLGSPLNGSEATDNPSE